MDTTTNMLWHSKCRCKGIDRPGGMGQNRKLGDFQRLAYGIDII